jgi:ubiquinone/menaquinone biosynthesis C-methylase UbiE
VSSLSVPAPRRSVAPIFDVLARAYDTEIVQRIGYRPAQDEVVAELRKAGSRRILDVGCGTGILAARIDDELSPEIVYGCDASAGMLAQAQSRSSEVHWCQGQAEHLPLPDGEVDAVVSTNAFHFFDKPAALADFFRVLAPGGIAVVVMVSSPTVGISRLTAVSGTGSFPTRREMRALFGNAGFDKVTQRRVDRPFLRIVPECVTTGVKR